MAELMDFELPKSNECIIKVIGVGGGGGNAVNHMFRQGIKDVDFAVCNTDAQALISSPVPLKVQLGASLTEGRGAGNKPEIGCKAAKESIADLEKILSGTTKMVFITAGMGGGTGTGAAPVIAEVAKKMGLLTVGIVTIPFRNEGRQRINQAIKGIREIENHVDSLLVINNERIREIYGDFPISKAFSKADDVLAIAAKGIAEIITYHGFINVDFEDVKTVMVDSGVSVMGSFTANGENRALKAVEGSLNSPLLNNNNICGAKNILVNITSGNDEEVTMDEMNLVNEYVQEKAGNEADLIYGVAIEPRLGDSICVTVIATGFKSSSIAELNTDKKPELESVSFESAGEDYSESINREAVLNKNIHSANSEISHKEPANKIYSQLYETAPQAADIDISESEVDNSAVMKVDFSLKTEKYVEELTKVPAYKRRKMKTKDASYQNRGDVSGISISIKGGETYLRKNNSFLHDKAD
jgi:cell division protein FtsZ